MTKYLKKNHSEYREFQVKAMKIVEENPALRILINNMEGIVLTPEDHKALLELPQPTNVGWGSSRGRGSALSLRMISVIYTQQVQKGRCEKTQSSFFTSPFLKKK